MFSAGPGAAARVDFGPIGNITPQLFRVLVVDNFIFISAEETYLALGHISCPVGSHPRTHTGSS